MKTRHSGVLLNISSLRGSYAIGGFGDEVGIFADYIASMGFHYWQVLPMTAIGFNNSPYSSVSSFAGNYLYVSPDLMNQDGLISTDELMDCRYDTQLYRVDYNAARMSKRRLLEISYANNDLTHELGEYLKKEGQWLKQYATYMTIKECHNQLPWWEWPDELKTNQKKAVTDFIKKNSDRFYFYVFEQYIFDSQWKRMKQIVNDKGVRIIGDMPIYVALDSADVWNNTSQFQLDNNLNPTAVAGVPPDYFSATGQLWGNPLYDYDKMKKDGYSWWVSRMDRMLKLYDVVRIDHFRGLYKYWSIEPNETTAQNGKWKDGPGMDLISLINKKFDSSRIIAEDLGTIDDDVRKFLKDSTYMGMKVLQFAFSDYESTHLPHNYSKDCIAYTATHDNNTTLGWLYAIDDETRNYVFDYLQIDWNTWGQGGYGSKSVKSVIRSVISSCANLAIIPYQDLCGYGADTRMNIPGICDGNWEYRMTTESYENLEKDYFLHINNLYGRNNDFEKETS